MAIWKDEKKYDQIITGMSLGYLVPEALIKGIIAKESGFNPKAYKAEPHIGDASRGLMQVLNRTAKALGFVGHVDELYDRTIVKPTVALANSLWKKVDVAVIDAMVNGVGSAALLWAQGMRVVQSGQVQHYALAMALGAVTILGVYLLFMP